MTAAIGPPDGVRLAGAVAIWSHATEVAVGRSWETCLWGTVVAAGRDVVADAFNFVRLREDGIAAMWLEMDGRGLMQPLGLAAEAQAAYR